MSVQTKPKKVPEVEYDDATDSYVASDDERSRSPPITPKKTKKSKKTQKKAKKVLLPVSSRSSTQDARPAVPAEDEDLDFFQKSKKATQKPRRRPKDQVDTDPEDDDEEARPVPPKAVSCMNLPVAVL